MNRLLTRLAELAQEAWHHRPILTTHARVDLAVDDANVTGYLEGRAAALKDLGPLPAEATSTEVAVLMGRIAGKLATGQITKHDLTRATAALENVAKPKPRRHPVRVTSGGYTLAVASS